MKKLLALLLVMGLLMSLMSGCGVLEKFKEIKDGLSDIGNIIDDPNGLGDDDDDDNDDNDDDDGDDDALYSGSVYYPETVYEIMTRFQEFGFAWTEIKEDGGANDFSIYYSSQEGEEIDGQETLMFTVATTETDKDDREYTFWLNSDWQCLKAEEDGEEIEVWAYGNLTMMLSIYVNHVKLTKMVVDEDGMLETFSFSLEEKNNENSQFGSMEVYRISDKFTGYTRVYGLVKIDGELNYMLVRAEKEGSHMFQELQVTHAGKR